MNQMKPATELLQVLTTLDFDVAEGVTLCGSDEDFYCDLIRELHEDVLTDRSHSLGGTDLQRRRDYAHLLKGTLQTLGEKRASRTARELEFALRNDRPSEELAQQLLDDLERIDQALRAFFSQ